jgi:hypothetical protein
MLLLSHVSLGEGGEQNLLRAWQLNEGFVVCTLLIRNNDFSYRFGVVRLLIGDLKEFLGRFRSHSAGWPGVPFALLVPF